MVDDPKTRGRGRPRQSEAPNRDQRLRTVDRALSVFSLVSREVKAPLNVISATADLPASTTHRILETLRDHRMVFFDELTQTWSIGVEAFRIGQSYARRINFLDVARQLMRDLTHRTGETSNLAVMEHWEVVTITQVESESIIRAFMPPGSRCSPHASGAGKALMAFDDAARIEELIDDATLSPYTPMTLTDPEALRADLDQIQERGWALDDEERSIGMRCVAAPIFNEYKEPIAGLSVSGPSSRMNAESLDELARDVCRVADTITHRSGGRHPFWRAAFHR